MLSGYKKANTCCTGVLSKYSTFIHTLVSAVNSDALIRLLVVESESVFRRSLISHRYGTKESDVDVRVMMVSFCR